MNDTRLLGIPLLVFVVLGPPPAMAARAAHQFVTPPDSLAVTWNAALLQAVRNSQFAPMFTARALAIVHTCMYDAWAAYDDTAVGTQFGSHLRRPAVERTEGNKSIAVSYAAYRALADLFPSQTALFDGLMQQLELDPLDDSVETPAGVGNIACAAVLEWRHHDGANQLGDLGNGPYADYTGYAPVNAPDRLVDPSRWQPLVSPTGQVQTFLAPHWRYVQPFALERADQFRPKPPRIYPHPGYVAQADDIREASATLTDRQKMIAEYWNDGPGTDTPPGHWSAIAQFVSRRDRHGLDDDVKLFFALGNALLDASIAVWDCKVSYDYVRPVSAVRFLFAGQLIFAWGGPFQGTRLIPGEHFRSYIATPPFAEYTSGHSAFSAVSATILRLFTGHSFFGGQVTFPAGSSSVEPGLTPATEVTLMWHTFDEAADEAGLSRRYGGIHFRQADLESRQMGKDIGRLAWRKALAYFSGAVHPPTAVAAGSR